MTLFAELNGLMANYRFKPEKKMAQHFVTDEAAIKKVLELACLKKSDVVLEVGAGTGFLTRELQKHCRVKAVELDDALFELLKSELKQENLELFHGNFLEIDAGDYNKVVAFPPYTISSEMVYRILWHGFEKAVLVFQSEFAERLIALPGFFDYNALSVITQYYCSVEIAGSLDSDSFFPRPNAKSAIVVLSAKKRFGVAKNEKGFERFVQELFRYKNKNLSNAAKKAFAFLEKCLGLDEKRFFAAIEKSGLKARKVYLLSCKNFVELFNACC
jgi:16S rRNA (adenine1518-N6/adenine1519-N6)-dimethyltransferase